MIVEIIAGKRYNLEILPTDRIIDIKTKFSTKYNIQHDSKFNLVYNNKILNNMDIISNIVKDKFNSDFTNKIILNVDNSDFQIFIRNTKGKTATLNVKYLDPVNVIFDHIVEMGYSLKLLRLLNKSRILKPNMTLFDQNINPDSQIDMLYRLLGD